MSAPALPSRTIPRHAVTDLTHWWVVTRHQLLNYFRTGRFLGLLAFVFAVSALTLLFEVSAGVAAVRVEQLYRPSEYLSNFLSYTGGWVILAAAFFGGDALSVDFSTGAGYYMLVLPIRRPVLLAGRYAAAVLVTLAIVGVYYAFAVGGAVYFFGGSYSIPWNGIVISLGVAAVVTLAALSFAFCISSFIRSPVAGVLVTLLILWVGFLVLANALNLVGLEPWWSLQYAGQAIDEVLDTDGLHKQLVPIFGNQYYTIWTAGVYEGLTIAAAYVAAFLPLSAYLYQRKEMTG